jgi:CBS domain containing-hemolysin-like protein
MSETGIMAVCLALVFVAAFGLSVFHLAIENHSKISLSRLLEKKDKAYRIRVIKLFDDIRIAVDFVRSVLLIALVIFIFLIFRESERKPLEFFLIFLAIYLVFFEGLPRLLNGLTRDQSVAVFLPSYRLLLVLASPLLLLSRVMSKRQEEEEAGEAHEASEEEIETFLDEAREEGIIEKDEDKLLRGVVEFGDTLVREIMTPRVNMVLIREDATIDRLRELVNAEQYSRIPVYRDRLDNVEGVVLAKDLLKYSGEENRNAPIKPLIRPVHFVPESMKVSQLLKELQRRKEKLAVVVDEHGGVSGLATIEDLIEEIVGEIQDEYDTEEHLIAQNAPGDYTVSGEVEVEDVEDLLGSKLSVEEQDVITMGGFVTNALGRLPKRGEKLEVRGVTLEVLEVGQKRVLKLRVRKHPQKEQEE